MFPARASIVAALFCACAMTPPAEQLAALEARVSAQRARSAAVERYLAELEPVAAPEAPGAGAVPYYELAILRASEPLDSRYEPLLRTQLAEELARSDAKSLEYRAAGEPQRFGPPWQEQQFPGVSLAALFAAGHVAAPQYRGAEVDVRVAVDPGPDRLVTVIHEVDGRIAAFDAVTRDTAENADGPDPDALRARYGIGPVEGWSARERVSLDQALGLLRPAERSALAGLPFRRKGQLPFLSSGPRHCGHFELEQEERSIAVYDCAFNGDSNAFVGTLERPLRPSVRIILHEIGHALAAGPLGALLADVATSQRETQQMVEAFNRLGRNVAPPDVERVRLLQGEIEKQQTDLRRWHEQIRSADHLSSSAVRAFLKLDGASSGFTSYGRSTPIEGFAEAFSLCRSDPEAGRRISREVCAFFNSDWVPSGS